MIADAPGGQDHRNCAKLAGSEPRRPSNFGIVAKGPEVRAPRVAEAVGGGVLQGGAGVR
jgi:hypothetical protein